MDIWQASVSATHLFLTDEDIKAIRPEVIMGLKLTNTLCIIKDKQKLVGFAGIDKRKLEMLFIHPDYFGLGIGYKLLTYVVDNFSVKYVDVNEQNPKALAFYQRQGFLIVERSPQDEMGRNFPILHLVKRS